MEYNFQYYCEELAEYRISLSYSVVGNSGVSSHVVILPPTAWNILVIVSIYGFLNLWLVRALVVALGNMDSNAISKPTKDNVVGNVFHSEARYFACMPVCNPL